ncbi:MAG: hypothetical protein Ct9H300mP18_05840 [Candidatus Neomarinimicrobiota bacterium]|nr:MAG: hypothetical protein Ct9H300mP18_05840 [Candidatus Neomarinimicrobiota bacterium]
MFILQNKINFIFLKLIIENSYLNSFASDLNLNMAINISFSTLTKYLKSALILFNWIVYNKRLIIYLAPDLPSLDQLENYDPDLVQKFILQMVRF